MSSRLKSLDVIWMLFAPQSIIARTHCISPSLSGIVLHELCLTNPVFQCRIDIYLTFLPSGSQRSLMIVVRSDEVELRPESPLVPAPPTLVFWWLSVERSLALDLSIAALSLLKLQSKIIHMVAELRLSIILVL
jgi:hypothetical protein